MSILARLRRLIGLRPEPAGPRFIISRDYQIDVPFPAYDSQRPFRILSYLERRRLLRAGMLRRPRPVSLQRLQRVHDPDYVRSLREPGAMEAILGFRLDPRAQDAFLDFQRLVCGGTLLAARNALARGDVAINLGGGLHHAERARGSGFCVFNDVAVAIDHLREVGHTFPILVIDLDLHDGDGTRAIYADDPSVHTLSIHNRHLGRPAGATATSVALGTGIDDRTYLEAVREHVPRALADCEPGLVFYLAGSDPWVDDRLGDWQITMEGMLARDRFVMSRLRPTAGGRRLPTVILLAGGYGPTAWRPGAAFFSWLLSGDSRLDVPLEMELPVDHYRRLVRHMRRPGLLPGEEAEPVADWGLTEADLGGGVTSGRSPGSNLFLGLHTRHGLELMLEESGLIGNLATRGYRDLDVQIDLGDPLGHVLRIVAGHRDPVVLIEVKLRIVRRHEACGRDCLVVEWLLLQDVQPTPAPSRPLLPGQQHPGTGLLRDMAAVLIVSAEKLGLAGVLFTPSHYHLARLARPVGRFPDPRDEARYLAMARALRGLRLREASAAVDGGRLREMGTDRVARWEPRPMVIPVDPSLKKELHGDAFRAAVTRAGAEFGFRLAP